MADIKHIRNFALIAHIDHGKSTLADRLIQKTGGLSDREMQAQVLDNMELERERGITIKAQTVRLNYKDKNGSDYILNVIDTPGHVDFSYEVSRSLRSCEGAVLLIDASQGVEAQTLANAWAAIEADLEILPVFNKIDLPQSDPDNCAKQLEESIGLDISKALSISAKSGEGVDQLLDAIIRDLPCPKYKDEGGRLKMLLVDSWYDPYLGVIVLVRVLEGVVKPATPIRMMGAKRDYIVDEIGVFLPKKQKLDQLGAGEIGYLTASIRKVADARIGDTITNAKAPCAKALQGFRPSQPSVFCALFPEESGLYDDLRSAMEKLHLNDAGFIFEAETSQALGLGFRCGFLGLLHMDIIIERVKREYGIELISTAPGVIYRLHLTNGEVSELHNPADMPEAQKISKIEEPWMRVNILTPENNLGAILALAESRRGRQKNIIYMQTRIMAVYDLPLSEIIFDFHDALKSASKGFASFDYQALDYEEGDLVKLSILVNNEAVDALFTITHRSRAEAKGRAICQTLKEEIPRHLFKVPLQAAVGGRVVARETIPALRKDVTAKCYGGDITRKRKLLEKQKKGKLKMRQFGKVDIPQKAFLQVLKSDI